MKYASSKSMILFLSFNDFLFFSKSLSLRLVIANSKTLWLESPNTKVVCPLLDFDVSSSIHDKKT